MPQCRFDLLVNKLVDEKLSYCITLIFAQIRDGRRETDRLIGRYCGADETGRQPKSTGPGAVVIFHSDASGAAKGFTIAFNAKSSTYQQFS